MKLWKYLGSAVIAVSLFTACKSPVYVQRDSTVDLRNYRTYMWVNTANGENDNATRPMAYADISVKNSVNAELNKVGWQEVNENPDVLLSYDVLVERTVDQRSNPVYSQSFSRWYFNPYTRRWSSFYYPSQFLGYQTYQVPVKQGTITVTMIDARTDKLAWQGWTTEQLNYSRLTDDEIDRSVRNIFGKFDLGSR